MICCKESLPWHAIFISIVMTTSRSLIGPQTPPLPGPLSFTTLTAHNRYARNWRINNHSHLDRIICWFVNLGYIIVTYLGRHLIAIFLSCLQPSLAWTSCFFPATATTTSNDFSISVFTEYPEYFQKYILPLYYHITYPTSSSPINQPGISCHFTRRETYLPTPRCQSRQNLRTWNRSRPVQAQKPLV